MKYLPWIVVGAIVLYLLTKLKSNVGLAPQTQFQETPQSDPFAQLRGQAFGQLAEAAGEQTRLDVALEGIKSQLQLGLASEQTTREKQTQEFNVAAQGQTFTRDLQAQAQLIAQNLGLERIGLEREQLPLQIDLAKYLQQSQLDYNRFVQDRYFSEREQDRQLQQSAIDRYYQTRSGGTTGQIIGSISQAISSILGGGKSGGIFGTPPTFPSFGGLF